MQLSEETKTFSQFFFSFFFGFLKFRIHFERFQKKVAKLTLIADVFLNLVTIKNVVRKMSKNSPFKRPLEK